MNQDELLTKDMDNKVESNVTEETSDVAANESGTVLNDSDTGEDTPTDKQDNNYVPPLQNQFWTALIVFVIVLIFILIGGSNLFK